MHAYRDTDGLNIAISKRLCYNVAMVKRPHDTLTDTSSNTIGEEELSALFEAFTLEERQAWLKARMDEVVDAHMSGEINSQEYTRRIESLEYAASHNNDDHDRLVAKVNKTPRTIGRRIVRSLFHS